MLRGLSRGYDALVGAMAALAAAIGGGLAVMICVNILLRNFGLGSIPGANELSEYGLYALTLLGAPWVLIRGGHVRMDLFVNLLPVRMRSVAHVAVCILGTGICAVVGYYGVIITLVSQARGSLILQTHVFPEWWLFVLLPVTMAVLALGFARDALRLLAGRDPGFREGI